MESWLETRQRESSAEGRTLLVDFCWKRFQIRITSKNDPELKPICFVDCNIFKPNLVFKTAADNSPFATGSLHAISINADCKIRGQPIVLKPLKRFKTGYTYPSHAFSDTDTPVPMTWVSTMDFKTWDFICLDAQKMPVAKFSTNFWAITKMGNIKFMGSNSGSAADSDAMRDEMVVTGLTLFFCMLLRTKNCFSLFGAVFARLGRIDKDVPEAVSLQDEIRVDGRYPSVT